MVRVAVYGMLRRDFHLSGYLAQSRFLGEHRLKGFDLYVFKQTHVPMIKRGKGEVTVEVYEVSDYLICDLDIVEAVNQGLYRRETVKINGANTEVYVGNLFQNQENLKKIESGDFKEYYRNIYKSNLT